ncbi:MAG TPA: hydrolase [Gammaproteobacteria bacterium]|nr:hydrolase [Gammaproteobacteria bacterium]
MNRHETDHAPFQPAWWLPGSHLQTIWPTVCRRPLRHLSLKRERFELDDGDFIDLDWTEKKDGPIVLILHGLEGSIQSPYAKGMLQAVSEQGWRGVFMHFRGCSGEMNRLPRGYHSGETNDVARLVETLLLREKCEKIAAVGFSLGGNVLLKWLGERGVTSPLCAAVGISVPFELGKTATRIRQGFSRVYEQHFMRSLRKKIRDKSAMQPLPVEVPLLKELRSLREFDDKITAPLHGFLNAEDYYKKSSSRQFLKNISVPTLLLQSGNDPFMTKDVLPGPDELSKEVTLELTEQGGHVGFISGKFPWRAEYWLEKRVPAFLQHYL